jgi:hypothetical protein
VSLKMRQIGRDLGDLSRQRAGRKMLEEINDAHLAFVVNTYGYFIFSIISYINGKSSCVLCELKEAY